MTPQEALELKPGDRLRTIKTSPLFLCSLKIGLEAIFEHISDKAPYLLRVTWDRNVGDWQPMDGGWDCSRFEKIEMVDKRPFKEPINETILKNMFGPFNDVITARSYLGLVKYPVWVSGMETPTFGGSRCCKSKEEAVEFLRGFTSDIRITETSE